MACRIVPFPQRYVPVQLLPLQRYANYRLYHLSARPKYLQYTAAQIFSHPAVQASLEKVSTSSLPLQPPSARSVLLPYTQFLPRTRPIHFIHSYSFRITPSAQYLFSNYHIPCRSLSLFRSPPLPPPRVLAQIHLLETAANASPKYVEAQVAYYQALVDSGLPNAYQRVISRWERMLEFVCPLFLKFLIL